jgi:CheY-like chemotaxis protein
MRQRTKSSHANNARQPRFLVDLKKWDEYTAPFMPAQGSHLHLLIPIAHADYGLASGRKRLRTPRTARGRKHQSRRADHPRRVLVFGRILELALYRAEVLRSRGYSVVAPRSKADAVRAIEDGEFDALVLSYTVESETAEEIVELARQTCPGCPLITISDSGTSDRKLRPDLVVRANEGPAGLLKALQKVFCLQ